MKKLSEKEKAYIAGFLDGDGSIYVRLKPNSDYRFRFQIAPAIVFYQAEKEKHHLVWLQRKLGEGYLRKRKDGIVEYTIGDVKGIESFLHSILPYLRLKRKQAQLMLKVLDAKGKIKTAKEFVRLAELIDRFQELNYSKKRTQNAERVKLTLQKEGLLAP